MSTGPIDYHYYPSVRIAATQAVASSAFRSALYYVEVYLNGLIIEWNRMVGDDVLHSDLMKQDITSNVEAAKAFSQAVDRLWLDIHFYLVCWDKINKHFKIVSDTSQSECINDAWHEISDLTEKASRARDFLEHLDKDVKRGGYGQRGTSFTAHREFSFWYTDTSGGGKKHERKVNLGRLQVERVMNAYEKVLSCLSSPSG